MISLYVFNLYLCRGIKLKCTLWDEYCDQMFGYIQSHKEEVDVAKIVGTSDMKKIKDLKGRPLLLFINSWSVGMTLERNEGLVLSEFGRA